MNLVHVYALYDKKADVVANVFISVNDATAKRSFLDLISSPHPSLFTSHFADFSLMKVCIISSEVISTCDKSELVELVCGSDYSTAEIINMRLKAAELSFPGNKQIKEDILHEQA